MPKEKQILVAVSIFFVCVTLLLAFVAWKESRMPVIEIYDTKSEVPAITAPTPSPLSPPPTPIPVSPVVPPENPITIPSKPTGKPCIVSGCSSQICGEESMMSTCEFREEYACYQKARCERQSDGACGWTMTDSLRSCLDAGGSDIQ